MDTKKNRQAAARASQGPDMELASDLCACRNLTWSK
jgi:hypothetical protein